jgi:outer membrane protein assembly factor BamA
VEYRPPNILDPADLRQAQILKVGSTLRLENVSEEIDRLFATGEFDDIRADAEPVSGGVRVIFVTTPARYLASVTIRGKIADPPNRGELAKVPQLIVGNTFHDEDLTAAVESMQKLLVANGLYEASVQPDIQVDPAGRQVFLRFRVRPRKRAQYEVPQIRGDTKLSDNTIIKATGWRVRFINRWKKVTEARTRSGLQGIVSKYQDAERLKAKVELEELKYDAERRRVLPRISVEAGPKVEVVATEAKVPKRILKRYVPVFQERTVDNDLLAEGARNLRDYFQARGYFDATVDFRTVSPEDDLERIEFAISRGQRYKLVHVSVTGNKYFDQETLRQRMFLEPASWFMRRGRYSEAFRKKDEENIANLYRSNGFRDVKVTSSVTPQHNGKQGQIGVVLRVNEGLQWLVDSVELAGIDEVDRAVFETNLASAPGQPFSEVNIAAGSQLHAKSLFPSGVSGCGCARRLATCRTSASESSL